MIRPLCWGLAIAATGTAICLSVLAGWQRGGPLTERGVWIAISAVLVVSAHLLPALVREAPYRVRAVASVLWLACMAAACFGHATFFVLAQRHAGELRAAEIPLADTAQVDRSLIVVMAERATVTGLLATANARRCSGDCTTLEARRVTLKAKLDALDSEADDIRRRQSADDRATATRDALVADPVTSRVAALLGTTVTRVDLLSGLVFAAILEGIACLLWAVTLRSGSPVPVVPPVAVSVAASHAPVNASAASLPAESPAETDVTKLAQAVAAGRVRPTVADIRRFLGCSQARAIALRRQLVELNRTA